MTEILRYERSGPVAIIAMDDGKVNCMSLAMLAELLTQATNMANALTQLNAKAHAESKLLVRERALTALRAAIESELGSFDVFTDTVARALKVGC